MVTMPVSKLKGALGQSGRRGISKWVEGPGFKPHDEVANTEGMEKRTVEETNMGCVRGKDTGRDADADWVQVPELMELVMGPFDIGLEGTVGVLTVGAGTDGGSID